MRALLLSLLLFASPVCAGLARYPQLIAADAAEPGSPPARGVRITYLGTNGYLLESKSGTLLVDPYFSRVGIGTIALNLPLKPDSTRVAAGMRHLPRKVDAVLVTHGHFDHLLDVPRIAQQTGAKLIASRSSVLLAQSAGLPAKRCVAATPGQVLGVGAAKIHVLPAAHDRLFSRVPFPGSRSKISSPPRRASDWVCGEPLAFLIELGGQRIYIDSGGNPDVLPPHTIGPVDLAILGVALSDSRKRLGPMLDRLRPRFFLPSHQDDFFRSLNSGFVFGAFTDFPMVRRLAAQRSERLLLLDYFLPWTLR